jgi:ABC-2 type transport system ATP-binding protein
VEKRFGEVRALRGLDLAVPEGTVCGMLGPNGAGKTTAVRVLTTLTAPDAGSARVAGHDVVREARAVREAIAVTGQSATVDGELTGRQNLRLFARLLHLRGAAGRSRAEEMLDLFELTEAADRVVRSYSGGMRRRLDLAACLLARPRVLFLDEPTAGLDPHSRNRIWERVRELAAEGTTVLLTTQYLEEADQLADEIVLVDRGRSAHRGTPAGLKALVGAYAEAVVPEQDSEGDTQLALTAAAGVLDRLTGAVPALNRARRTVGAVSTDRSLTLPRLVRELDSAGVPLADASLRAPTLDEVFLRLTGRPVPAREAASSAVRGPGGGSAGTGGPGGGRPARHEEEAA